MPSPWTIILILSVFSFQVGKAQTLPDFQPFTHTPVFSWNTTRYQSYQYSIPNGGAVSPMRFRLMSPNGFDRLANDGKKYPIIIFLHGSGEAGVYDAAPNNGVGEQDNEKQLTHGGQLHMNAVLNNTFPGFLLYPQMRRPDPVFGLGPVWSIENLKGVEYIIRKLVADYKVDPDRIYIHGLSLGGEGAWRFIAWRPDLFAAAHPMSAAGTAFWKNASAPAGYWTGEARQRYKHIPLRLSQGALDKGPLPQEGNGQVDAIREIGGNIRYAYYTDVGHATWNSEYSKPDFFSWFLSQRKNKIHVFGGQTSFCPGENFSVRLGLTPGFANYQWVKNDTTSAPFATGASVHEITVTQVVSASSGAGRYYARFQRSNGVWTRWSPAVDINSNRALSPTPTVATNGQSRNLPSLDGSPDITLTGNLGKGAYVWKKDAAALTATTRSITVSAAGTYSLRTRDAAGTGKEIDGITPTEFGAVPIGCLSAASAGVPITTQNGVGVPAVPGNFFAGANATNSIAVSWMDRSPNETGFELYRSTSAGVGYQLVSILPASSSANPQTYIDTDLQPLTRYYYRLRAVNNTGGSAYTPETSASTIVDNEAPTAPIVSLGATSRTAINLVWSGATDNVGVTAYEVYQNNVLINTTNQTSYSVTSVVGFSNYAYVVKSRDMAGNVSVASNQISAAAVNAGLSYQYFHHTGLANVSEIETKGVLAKTGVINNFLITPRTRNDGYAFVFDGYINIPATGSYTFWTESSEGSQLYVNNVLVVDNDGLHGCTEKQGSAVTLSAGVYPVKALNFENTGGECLTVKWQGPGITKQAIPDNALKDSYTPPAALPAPSAFTAAAAAYNRINLAWADNSNNETGFEISRALSSSGPFPVVKTTSAGVTAWADNTLDPGTQYFYKIRAINASSASPLVGPVNATTPAAPAAPPPPTALSGVANTPTQVTLQWSDNSTTETGFEIQRSSQSGTGFITLTTTAANVVSFVDTQANSHATIYYRVRALGVGGAMSAFNAAAPVVTANRIPTLVSIIDRCIAIGSNFSFDVLASDPDTDPISFTFPLGLPAFATFQSNGFGKGKLTFTNAVAGTYTIRVRASDGTAAVTDDFILTVNTNNSPVMADIPFQATEEGRTLLVTAAATDADASDVLTYTVANLPSFATWSASLRRITFKPLSGHAGIYENITVTVRDNKTPAGVDTRVFTLIVSPIDEIYTIALNFSTVPGLYEDTPWNNTGMPAATDITGLKDDQNNSVRYVAFNTGTYWATTAPQTVNMSVSPEAVFTEKVRESFYRMSSGGSGSQMKFKGLNPLMQYKVTLYGAGGWAGSTPPVNLTALNTKYIVTGLTSQQYELNTLNNTSVTVATGLIKPTAAGEITIAVLRGTNNTNNYYINALLLSGFFDDGSKPAAPSDLAFTTPAHDTVKVSWLDNSFNETRFDILRSTTLSGTYTVIGTAAVNATSFTDATTVGRKSYYYKVRAVNAAGSSDSSPQLVTTPNGIPVINSFATPVVKAGHTFQRTISATDPEGDPISFALLNPPSFATLVDNGNGTGYIQFSPLVPDIGTYSFTLEATDDFSGRGALNPIVIIIDPQYSEVVYLNFKGSGSLSNAGTPWNNIPAFTAATSLKNILGQSSLIQVKPAGGWTGSSNTAGVMTGADAGLYPDNVMRSFWSTSSTSAGASVTLKGLDNAKRYNLTLFGSLNEFWFANTVYTVKGISKTLSTAKNKSNAVKFSGIAPSGDSIVINIKRGPAINASPSVVQRDGILGAMIVEAASPGAIPLTPTNLVAEGISKSAIRLAWTDNASDETGFEIFRATSQSGPFTLIQTTAANVETFTNSGLARNTPYIYRVRAKKAGGTSAYTDDVAASTFNQVILVNVNSNIASDHLQASPPWNNFAAPPADGLVFSNFKDDANVITTVDLQVVAWESGGTNNTGFITGNNSGVYPDAVLENYYYFEQFDPPTQYRLAGLNGSHRYDLVFLGNEWTGATIANAVVATDFTVGSTTVSQFNGKNSMQTVAVKGISPASGAIAFEIQANAVARYGVWNALEIRSYSPIPTNFEAGRLAMEQIEELLLDAEIYPNPVTDKLSIRLPTAMELTYPVGIHIYTAQGIQIAAVEKTTAEEDIEINTIDLASGVYILKINVQEKLIVKRFVKK
jgi:fibronectin type 3 domain-containing protein/predicted esterase